MNETPQEIIDIGLKMRTQNNRSTAWPIFIVVEDKKIYGVDPDHASDGRDRKDRDIVEDGSMCDSCLEQEADGFSIPDDCDICNDECFVHYRIEKDVPNLRAGVFFTAEACDAHIEANRHHYNRTAHSYAISAYHNRELKAVMRFLAGKELT